MARETIDDQRVIVKHHKNGVGKPALEDAAQSVADAPGFMSPQQFYREATQREDARRILDALAK